VVFACRLCIMRRPYRRFLGRIVPPSLIPIGVLQWKLSTLPSCLIIHEIFLDHLSVMLSPASGFSSINSRLMDLLSAIKLVGYFVDSLSVLELILLKPSVRWSSLLQFGRFYLWLCHAPGLFISLMSTMLSCKAICLRRSIALSLLDSRTPHIQIMCAGLIAHFMVLSRRFVHGTAGLLHIFCSLVLLKLIRHFFVRLPSWRRCGLSFAVC